MSIIVASISIDAVRVQHTFRGKPCSFMIRPTDAEIIQAIQDNVKTYEFALNPKTKKMERVEIVDETAVENALYDHIIADWSEDIVTLNEEKKQVKLPCTPENKLRLAYLKPGKKEVPLWMWLVKTAREMGEKLHAELEEERKN